MRLDEGIYHAKLLVIGTGKLETAKATPYIWARWRITHIARDGAWIEIDQVERESRWWDTPAAEQYTCERLALLGFNGDIANPQFSATPHPQTDGVQLVCKHDTRGEKTYENWDLLREGGTREHVAWDADATRLFNAKFQTHKASSPAPTGASVAPPVIPDTGAAADPIAPDQTDDIADDEIPF